MIIGETISHYRVVALLGAGGMGEVYKAEDTRLKRAVALKFLPPALSEDREAKQRLTVEAQAVSTLDHPNICTIHEIDETADGRVFLAMSFYEGETLKQRIDRGTVPIAEALDIVVQIARGVAAAHEAGIIHRDIKPANIFLCSRGARSHGEAPATGTAGIHGTDDSARVKLLDFGIAKLSGQTSLTRTGTTVGTVAYMAPEHVSGHAIDERADMWSLGVVLYELLAGRLPFFAAHELAMARAIADDNPPLVREVRPDVPPAIEAIVDKAMQKNPTLRYASAHDLLRDLESVRATMRLSTAAAPIVPTVQQRVHLSRRMLAIGTAALLIVTVGGVWFASRAMRARVTQQRVNEIRRLVESEQNAAALLLLHSLPPEVADDAEVVKVRNDFFLPLTVRTDPPDAYVYIKSYSEPDAEWVHLGRSPVETRGTMGLFRWRVSKAGYETFEGSGVAPNPVGEVRFALNPDGTTPEGMLHIRGGNVPDAGRIPDFFIDKYELTNKEFKRFVESGGYRNAPYWQEPFVRDGQTLSWDEAIIQFRDATGRPGPATWELGTYPEGQDDWPVRGVSWYEAAAYARFAGKALPTVHHWRLAAAAGIHSHILEWSNFSGKAPARVGEYKGIGPHGTYDMAGNVKEWCANAVRDRRYILGGGWNEPNYQYRAADARQPFDRSANNGVRLVKLSDPSSVPVAAYNPIEQLARNYVEEKPVSDEVFAALARLYSYDASDLQPVVESSNDESSAWRVERVSYNAAYVGERIPAYLFLPKNASPPFQAIVYFPHSGGFALDSFQQAEMAYLGFLIKAGRALLFPMYQGTYERRLKTPLSGANAARDLLIQQIKDMSRSVDYLHTRSDIAHERVAYFGVSLGAAVAPMALAVERRFKTAILWSGGFPTGRRPPETDPINFAPRVTTPVLMLNGRDDFTFPVESSQEPMYRLLGTPATDKQRGVYEGGHVFPFSRMIKDSLDWLDRYLGTPK